MQLLKCILAVATIAVLSGCKSEQELPETTSWIGARSKNGAFIYQKQGNNLACIKKGTWGVSLEFPKVAKGDRCRVRVDQGGFWKGDSYSKWGGHSEKLSSFEDRQVETNWGVERKRIIVEGGKLQKILSGNTVFLECRSGYKEEVSLKGVTAAFRSNINP